MRIIDPHAHVAMSSKLAEYNFSIESHSWVSSPDIIHSNIAFIYELSNNSYVYVIMQLTIAKLCTIQI